MISLTGTLSQRRPRALGLVLAAAVVVAATYVGAALQSPPGRGTAPAGQPAPQASVGPLDAGGAWLGSIGQIDHSIEAWSKNLASDERDFLAATNVATLYLGRGRLSHDVNDLARALTAARAALAIEPTHVPARLVEASTLVSLHDFGAAVAAADALLVEDPALSPAIAVRFDAELELGRLDEARADLARLAAIGGPAVAIREARFASVTGDAPKALELARAARSMAADEETGDQGFYAYAVGEYARLAGDASTARDGFEDALVERDTDIGALVGLARIDAFEDRLADAISGLRRAVAIAPQPEALALLGDLLAATSPDDPGVADAYETVRYIGGLGDVQAATFDRQLIRFELDHGGADEALLAQARASLADRPDPAGHDLVAWALYRLGRFDEAAASIAAARALLADDARLRFHDGAIRAARGDRGGEDLLRTALDLGPALDPLERAEAARLVAD